MMKSKTFDCIAMKRRIQEAHAQRDADLSAEDRIAAMQKRIMEGPFPEIWRPRHSGLRKDGKAA